MVYSRGRIRVMTPREEERRSKYCTSTAAFITALVMTSSIPFAKGILIPRGEQVARQYEIPVSEQNTLNYLSWGMGSLAEDARQYTIEGVDYLSSKGKEIVNKVLKL